MIHRTSMLRTFNFNFFFASGKLLLLAVLVPLVLTSGSGHALTAASAFLTLALYNTVRLTMTLFFPNAVAQSSDAYVSMGRIQVSI